MRAIDADKLAKLYKGWLSQLILPEDEKDKQAIETCIAVLEDAPTIDPESLRPQGEWVDHMVRDWRCSLCGDKIQKVRVVDGYCYDDSPNYCPNCGARMKGEET